MGLALPAAVHEARALYRRQQRWFGGPVLASDETIATLIEVFEEQGAGWALVGAVAFGLRVEPRATRDIDFVVEARRLPAVIEALRERLGDLQDEDMGATVRLRALDVDLIRSSQHPLFTEALRRVEIHEGWRLPITEVLVALKFMSAVNAWRERAKRIQDAADLVALYQHATDFDRDLASRLAATAYPGAEQGLLQMLDRVDRGERLEI